MLDRRNHFSGSSVNAAIGKDAIQKKWRTPEVLLLSFWSALASSRAKREHYKSATSDSERHVSYLNFEVEAVAVFRCLARLAVHPAAQQPGPT